MHFPVSVRKFYLTLLMDLQISSKTGHLDWRTSYSHYGSGVALVAQGNSSLFEKECHFSKNTPFHPKRTSLPAFVDTVPGRQPLTHFQGSSDRLRPASLNTSVNSKTVSFALPMSSICTALLTLHDTAIPAKHTSCPLPFLFTFADLLPSESSTSFTAANHKPIAVKVLSAILHFTLHS